MDILKSSNIERILFDLYGALRTKELMSQLDNEHYYELTQDELKQLQQIFVADFCNDEEGKKNIQEAYKNGYLMDPHTATCFKAYDTCRDTSLDRPLKTIAYSTAEWTKFSPTIANALTGEAGAHDIDALKAISEEANISIPEQINALFSKAITQDSVVDKEDIEREIIAFLG